MNPELKKILDEIDARVELPMVDARFGDNWKESAKTHYSLDMILDIAWKAGRRALLLERELEKRL